MTWVNVNTIEFSITLQSVVNGDTPATFGSMPSRPGEPPNTASMCGTLPGSLSTTVTSYAENRSRMHDTVSDQVVALTDHAGIVVCAEAIEDRLVRASLTPGCSVTPFLFR